MASRNRGPLHWGIMRIEDVRPMHVAGYIEQLEALRKAPTVIWSISQLAAPVARQPG